MQLCYFISFFAPELIVLLIVIGDLGGPETRSRCNLDRLEAIPGVDFLA